MVKFEDSELHLKSKEDVLEISSTGYGLESVSIDNIEKQKLQESKRPNSSGSGEQ
ncbi:MULTISPECIES: hypothetical protein [Metabacillus]|uniref:Uncharacterized protein n=1 Tax=Metabacillus elymi TaxID=2745198 RepID=A0ABX6S6Q8_9BACI|nr:MULTISPECIES: hypothetical protein [Metabacillus]QNF29694.1 hypothetical protein HUW50_20715 [Metabacillus sp. KUDC1714]